MGMARSYRVVQRDQPFLLPPEMSEWLPEDHLVWFVLDVVDRLETSGFHESRRLGGQGRAGYDPEMLLALLVYAYAVGERSSRRIERLCTEHVAFRVLCAQDVPDHSTIARFRAAHHDLFAGLFAQVLRLCAAAGMVKVGVVAIDGTKIAANAAKGANRGQVAIDAEARRIAEEILSDADRVDAAEDARAVRSGEDSDRLPPGFADRSRRAANIERALRMLAEKDAQAAAADAVDAQQAQEFLRQVEAGQAPRGGRPGGVDPVRYQRARVARQQDRLREVEGVPGSEASYRRRQDKRRLKQAQQALAQAEQQAAAGQVDLRGGARRERERKAANARARGGGGCPQVNLTDPDSRLMTEGSGGGVVQGFNAQLMVTDDHLILGVHVSAEANDTNGFAPTLSVGADRAADLGLHIGTVLCDAGYFTIENLKAAGPDRLIAPGKNRELRPDPHPGAPPDADDPLAVMRHRMRNPENLATYKRRGAIVEPVIGHLKDQTKLRRFAQRGLQAVTAELHLAAAVLNLTKLHKNALATG